MSTYLTIWVLIHICITHGKNRLDLNINWSSGDLSQYKPFQQFENPSKAKHSGWSNDDFRIVEMEPRGENSQIPFIIISPDKLVTFSCTSSGPWDSCHFQHPYFSQPCGLLSHQDMAHCIQAWKDSSFLTSTWILKRDSPTKCSISGNSTGPLDEGHWNCFLKSKPLVNRYKSDQVNFLVSLISLSRLKIDNFPPKIDVIQRDVLEFEVHVADANPAPKLNWFIGSKEISIQLKKQSESIFTNSNHVSFVQQVHYRAHIEDSGKTLTCVASQVDTFGNKVNVTVQSDLTVRQFAPALASTQLVEATTQIVIAISSIVALLGVVFFIVVQFANWRLRKRPRSRTIVQVAKNVNYSTLQQTDGGGDGNNMVLVDESS